MLSLLQLLNSLLHATRFTKRENKPSENKMQPYKDHHHHHLYEMTRCWLRGPGHTANPPSLRLLAQLSSQPHVPVPLSCHTSSLPVPGAGQQSSGTLGRGQLTAVLVSCCQIPKGTGMTVALRRTHE